MSTQSTNNTTEATSPTGDIKVFIDAFNKDFDTQLKSLLDAQQNYKNVYADAIKISTPKKGRWPLGGSTLVDGNTGAVDTSDLGSDPKVVTIGDLFKYTFPDINSDKIVKPDRYSKEYAGWAKDLKLSEDEKIKTMYDTISNGISSNRKIEIYQSLKKPGITNPSLWSPGQYYFDVFMMVMLSPIGPLKDPSDANAGRGAFGGNIIEGGGWEKGWLKANGGSASVSNFSADALGATGSFGYIAFYEIIEGGYVGSGVKYRMIDLTDIDIHLDDVETTPPKSFPSLFTQYRTGPLSEFISVENSKINLKDPLFRIHEGIIKNPADKEIEISDVKALTDLTGYKFVGYYEHMLLYKAFIQAGDNYKSVVLPVRNPEEPQPVQGPVTVLAKNVAPTAVGEVQFKFNVEKIDTFIVVGGTVSPPLEFIIVPNDGTKYIIDTPDVFNNDGDLGDEYVEGDFTAGEELDIVYDEAIAMTNNFDYQSSTTTTTNSGDTNTEDNNINLPNVSPGEQGKHLYDFIQKRVKNGYKYLGTPVYNVSMADVSKLLSITKKYGIPLEWVANLINHESAGTWNPSIRNSIGATGLIQFMTNISGKRMTYAKADGSEPVDTDALRSMSFSKHLDYVDGFLSRGTKKRLNNGKVKKEYTQTDIFMTIFYPAAVGKPSFTFPGSVQKANGGITHPIDYTKKACNKNSPFPSVPDDLVTYVAKLGNGLIENSNVA